MADSTPQIDLLDGVAGMRGDSSAGSASVPVGGSGNATTTSAGNGEPGIAAVASPMVEVKAGPLVGGPTRKRDRSPTQPAPNKLIRTDAGAAHASQPTQTLIQIPPANANPAAPQTLRPQTGTPSTLPPTTSSLIPPTSAPQPATVPTIPPTTVTSHSSQPQTQQPSAPSKPEQAQSQNQGQSSSSQSQPSQQVPPPHRKRLDGEPPLIIDDPALTSLPEGVKERFLGSLRYHSPRYPRPALPTTSSVSLHPLPPFTGVDLYGVLEVRVPALECSVENLGVKKRAVWGTGVYTDDSDVVAALIHSGWIRPSDAPPIVSPPANFSTAGYQLPTDPPPPPSSFPQPPPLPIPVDSVPGRTVVARLRVLPKLTRYAGTLRNGLRSRSWGGGHGGESFRVEGVELLDEPTRGGRKSEVKTFGDSEGIVVVVGEGLLDDEPPTTFNSGLAPNSLLFPALPSDAPPDRARIDDARMRAWQAGWDELSKLYKGVRLPALWNEGWEGWRVRMEVEVLYMDVIEGQKWVEKDVASFRGVSMNVSFSIS
ncbi:Rxt3-domain-containing protein [Gonapodya prolifera JEL478]|uniref:Rxt3-domain-containing protein n=1 Tax=Gonapodya prolifera (strain JEL478) TaxID=1344416 RepID=A0A139A2A4_GONPJ|nr:Rxt3-domain-containing protein [Gonapodya prolifera JEL478]|eukprot:KXS10871.1 Rxt3-domain-containing protein [Gonapodya prolifera JEL478]